MKNICLGGIELEFRKGCLSGYWEEFRRLFVFHDNGVFLLFLLLESSILDTWKEFFIMCKTEII